MPRDASGGRAPIDLTVTAWSYSRWAEYTECPARFRYAHLEKRPRPTGDAMARGQRIHEAAEQYLKGAVRTLPPDLKRFAAEFRELRRLRAVSEEGWAFRRDWVETEWFAKDVWVRVKLDATAIPESRFIRIIDFKTGKVRAAEENRVQLELYATAALARFDADAVSIELWYLDAGVIVGGEDDDGIYTADRADELQRTWAERSRPMLADRRFTPRPGFYCRWCEYRKDNAGPCRF